jgi:transposase InsO family protein
MNRPQLPAEVKSFACQRIESGEWTIEEAVIATSFTERTVKRWLAKYRAGGVGALRVSREGQKGRRRKELCESTRALVDSTLARLPHLRTRSMQDYLRRHHQLKVPRRALERYLKCRGFVDQAVSNGKPEPRRFEAAAPMNLVQVDILWVGKKTEGRLYVVNVLDDHSRFLLGSIALTKQTGEAVLKTFCEVIHRWGTPRAVLTDRGTQFAHWNGRTRFQDYVEKELRARHILASPEHPQTLGKVERFHRTLRKEKLSKREGCPDLHQLQADLNAFADYYNYERPHQALGGLTPADRFYSMGDATACGLAEAASGQGDERIFLTANLMGRRLVLAGRDSDSLRVLWDDAPASGDTERERPIW